MNQQLDHLGISFHCRPHERRLPRAILRVDPRGAFEQSLHRARSAGAGAIMRAVSPPRCFALASAPAFKSARTMRSLPF